MSEASLSPRIRLSCGDHSFPLLPHEKALDLITLLGFEGVNVVLWGTRSQLRPADVLGDPEGWAAELEDRVRGRGLDFADIVWIPGDDYRTLALNHPHPAEYERSQNFVREMLAFTARVQAPGLTILPGVTWPGETQAESLERAAEALRLCVDAAREHGVRLGMEPHLGSVCEAPADVARLCADVPGLELTLDYTHFVANGFAEGDVDPLLSRARHLHARGGAPGRLQTSLRESVIDYGRIVDLLKSLSFDGYIAVEYVWNELDGLAGVDVVSETILLSDRLRARLDENS